MQHMGPSLELGWETPPTSPCLSSPPLKERKRPSGLGLRRGPKTGDAATTAFGSQPFRAICPILFPPTLHLFSSAAQPVSYFLQHSEARAPQAPANDFPVDEIRSKRGSLTLVPRMGRMHDPVSGGQLREKHSINLASPAGEDERKTRLLRLSLS